MNCYSELFEYFSTFYFKTTLQWFHLFDKFRVKLYNELQGVLPVITSKTVHRKILKTLYWSEWGQFELKYFQDGYNGKRGPICLFHMEHSIHYYVFVRYPHQSVLEIFESTTIKMSWEIYWSRVSLKRNSIQIKFWNLSNRKIW